MAGLVKGVRSLRFLRTISWTLDILTIHTKQLLTGLKCRFVRRVVAMTPIRYYVSNGAGGDEKADYSDIVVC